MQYVNIEFFDEEMIENVITCMNFKMDKVIFFGYDNTMTEEKKETADRILKKKLGVKEVFFEPVNKNDLNEAVEKIFLAWEKEQKIGNRCYFDLTGGEDLVLVAIGMLAERCHIPMHKYDIKKNLLMGFSSHKEQKINKTAPKQEIQLTLDDIIQMQGGKIDNEKQKDYKDNLEKDDFKNDILNMWKVSKKNAKKWNAFSSVLKECNRYATTETIVAVPWKQWSGVLRSKNNAIWEEEVLEYFRSLEAIKVMDCQILHGKNVELSYKSKEIKEIILDAGSLLELNTFYEKKSTGRYSDVRVGVHLDWNGEKEILGKDVENEVDLMLLEGNIPTFISCKNGEVAPMALYELDAITKELGGKYAQKAMVVGAGIASVQRERAKRMEIEIWETAE